MFDHPSLADHSSFSKLMRALFGLPAPTARDPIDESVVPAVVSCPECDTVHVDDAEWAQSDHQHKSHLCLNCGHVWRPYPFHTVGVSAKVGDKVLWCDVPTHSLVGARIASNGFSFFAHTVRLANRGWCVSCGAHREWDDIAEGNPLPWQTQWGNPWSEEGKEPGDPDHATIIALGLRGDETGDELRALWTASGVEL